MLCNPDKGTICEIPVSGSRIPNCDWPAVSQWGLSVCRRFVRRVTYRNVHLHAGSDIFLNLLEHLEVVLRLGVFGSRNNHASHQGATFVDY